MKKLLQKTDEWARRRIRAVYWKQWKKIKTKCRMLKALGLEDWKAKEIATINKKGVLKGKKCGDCEVIAILDTGEFIRY